MKYYSTEGKSEKVSFERAVINGLAPDRGLYFPEKIGLLDKKVFDIDDFSTLSFEIAKVLLDNAIPEVTLKTIIDSSFNFPVPLKKIDKNIYILELFHGPTAAFKDFGARFMAYTLNYLLARENKKVTILVATSGDTGSAVANGFYGMENIDVIILYPSNKVSHFQEKQLTTLGGNITALEVDGTFDDCQKLVKDAFVDSDLNSKISLSSANSINIARLYPQSFYYVWAYNLLKKENNEIICCTPSGNFGNLTAGLLAKKLSTPINKFIAATNINDVVPEYLDTGIFSPRSSKKTHSNAMDVGNPSNFARMLELYDGNRDKMAKDIVGFKVTDEETLSTISDVYKRTNYILDPHTAVGYFACEKFIKNSGNNKLPIVLLSTAHPSKFSEIIEKTINVKVDIPSELKKVLEKEKVSIKVSNKYDDFKNFLMGK